MVTLNWEYWPTISTYDMLFPFPFRGGCFLFDVAMTKSIPTLEVFLQFFFIERCPQSCHLLWTIYCVLWHIWELDSTMVLITVAKFAELIYSQDSFNCWEHLSQYLFLWCIFFLNMQVSITSNSIGTTCQVHPLTIWTWLAFSLSGPCVSPSPPICSG